MNALTAILLFFYGTTPSAVVHHTSHAKTVAYTLGGIIAFVTVPFVFVGVTFLASTHISSEDLPGSLRWCAILAIALVLTFAIVWLERALVILGDAIASHWLAQLGLLAIRLLVIALLSVVIAQKWEEAAHRGLIRAEKQAMRDEAIAQHRGNANKEFDVSGLTSKEATASSSIESLEAKIATLPANLVAAQANVSSCQQEARRLWIEYNAHAASGNMDGGGADRLVGLRARASAKSADCKQLDVDVRKQVDAYRSPLNKALEIRRAEHASLVAGRAKADQDAASSYEGRMTEANRAFTESGMDAKAFARVRSKNPDIDAAVKAKTALLAAIELLPLVLKLLLWNSPISAEARANLQAYSAWYRAQTRLSIQNEKAGVVPSLMSIGVVPMGAPLGQLAHSPLLHSSAAPSNRALDANGYWVGYDNT